MKITDIKVFPVNTFVFVKILTDDGLYGIGEASLYGRALAVVETLGHIKPLLIGQDATRIEHIWQDIFRGTFWRGGPVLQSALAGIDIALWDLQGKALGVPVYRLLGGATRDKVLVYRHVFGRAAEQLVDVSKAMLEEGWRVLRISPTTVVEQNFDQTEAVQISIDHFKALRNAVGILPEIILEVHTRLTPARAIELCNAVEEFRPFFVEDPIRSENPASFEVLRSHTNMPIATGEQLSSKWAFRELIEKDLIDYLRIDICHSGGITEGRKIAAMGEVHYQELALHATGGPVGTSAMFHLNMSVPNFAVQEYGPAPDWLNEVIPNSLETQDGYLFQREPDLPGLGIDLDEKAAAAHPYSAIEPPHLRRRDGSVQDW